MQAGNELSNILPKSSHARKKPPPPPPPPLHPTDPAAQLWRVTKPESRRAAATKARLKWQKYTATITAATLAAAPPPLTATATATATQGKEPMSNFR